MWQIHSQISTRSGSTRARVTQCESRHRWHWYAWPSQLRSFGSNQSAGQPPAASEHSLTKDQHIVIVAGFIWVRVCEIRPGLAPVTAAVAFHEEPDRACQQARQDCQGEP